MPGLVPGIHVFAKCEKKDVDGLAEATPFYERLCPAMTKNNSSCYSVEAS